MKVLIFTLLIIGCAYALPAPIISVSGNSGPTDGSYVIDIDQTQTIGGGGGGNVGVKDKGNLEGAVDNAATVVKEPLGWALGTVTGLATGALNGVKEGLNGLKTGGIGGLLKGLTGGIAHGAAKGFSHGLGGVMKS